MFDAALKVFLVTHESGQVVLGLLEPGVRRLLAEIELTDAIVLGFRLVLRLLDFRRVLIHVVVFERLFIGRAVLVADPLFHREFARDQVVVHAHLVDVGL